MGKEFTQSTISTFKSLWHKFLGLYPVKLLSEQAHVRPHWATIVDGLILGGLPIATTVNGYGDHGNKLLAQCNEANRPLSTVYAIGSSLQQRVADKILSPVTPIFWKNHSIKTELIPMDETTRDIELDKLKKAVDEINAQIRCKRSVYLHSSGSFTVAVCYLIAYGNLDVTKAMGLLYEKYPYISPTEGDLKLIELFRKKYFNSITSLNRNSQQFEGYQQGWASYLKNPLVIFGLSEVATSVLADRSWFTHLLSAGAGLLSYGAKKISHTVGDHAYEHLNKQYPTFSPQEKEALKTGMESEQTWNDWFSNLGNTNAMLHYSSYLAGRRAVQEKDPICAQVLPKVTAKP